MIIMHVVGVVLSYVGDAGAHNLPRKVSMMTHATD